MFYILVSKQWFLSDCHVTLKPVPDRYGNAATFTVVYHHRNVPVILWNYCTRHSAHPRCLDVTSTHVSSTVTFRPTWNVHCDTIPLWHFNLLSCLNPLTTSHGFFIHLILFGWIVTRDFSSTPFTKNVTFYLLWQFVHPWKIHVLLNFIPG